MRLCLTLVLCAACGGSVAPPAPQSAPGQTEPGPRPGWIDAAVQEALQAEVMPGTTEEPDPERKPALEAFFLAHPQYEDAERRSALWAHACGLEGTEAAHEYLSKPPEKEPLIVQVTTDDWRVFVNHADQHCTSDDWTAYAGDAAESATAHGATVSFAGPEHGTLIVQRDGKEVGRTTLSGTGHTALRAGQEPLHRDYGPSDLSRALETYYAAQ